MLIGSFQMGKASRGLLRRLQRIWMTDQWLLSKATLTAIPVSLPYVPEMIRQNGWLAPCPMMSKLPGTALPQGFINSSRLKLWNTTILSPIVLENSFKGFPAQKCLNCGDPRPKASTNCMFGGANHFEDVRYLTCSVRCCHGSNHDDQHKLVGTPLDAYVQLFCQ